MGLVLTDDIHYRNIANEIRNNLPDEYSESTYTPAEMPDGVAEVSDYQNTLGYSVGFQEGYEDGVVVGEKSGAAICADKHFVYNFVGDGGTSVSFYCPFEPDVVKMFAFDPLSTNVANSLMLFSCDNRAFGMPGGFVFYGNGSGGLANMSFGTRKIAERYSRTDDGVITVQNTGASSNTLIYGNGFVYTVVAVKYAEQADTERITEFVNRLAGSGTVTLNKAKVNAAFTDDEWAALIATRPSWTFTLM